MRKWTKAKIELTVAQVLALICAVGVVKVESKAVKTMFGLGAIGTTIWSIFRGVHLEDEDSAYCKEQAVNSCQDRASEKAVNVNTDRDNDKLWDDLVKAFKASEANLKKNLAENDRLAKANNEGVSILQTLAIDESNKAVNDYIQVTAPFVYMEGGSSSEVKKANKLGAAVKEVSIETLPIPNETKVDIPEKSDIVIGEKAMSKAVGDFDLLGEIESNPIKWAQLEVVGTLNKNIYAVDKAIFDKLRNEYNYTFIKEQAPTAYSWKYIDKANNIHERFIAVSVDLNAMMSMYRNGEIKGTPLGRYETKHIYKIDEGTQNDEPISSITELEPDTVYVSEKGTVLVLLGKSQSKMIHTVVSKHCKRISLVTLEALNKATCSCLWS